MTSELQLTVSCLETGVLTGPKLYSGEFLKLCGGPEVFVCPD